jgi:hypothetical protein
MVPSDAHEVPSAATLSALASQVEDLVARVGAGAEASDGPSTEGVAVALFDAERALRSALRALQRAERAR